MRVETYRKREREKIIKMGEVENDFFFKWSKMERNREKKREIFST